MHNGIDDELFGDTFNDTFHKDFNKMTLSVSISDSCHCGICNMIRACNIFGAFNFFKK